MESEIFSFFIRRYFWHVTLPRPHRVVGVGDSTARRQVNRTPNTQKSPAFVGPVVFPSILPASPELPVQCQTLRTIIQRGALNERADCLVLRVSCHRHDKWEE